MKPLVTDITKATDNTQELIGALNGDLIELLEAYKGELTTEQLLGQAFTFLSYSAAACLGLSKSLRLTMSSVDYGFELYSKRGHEDA